MNTIAPMCQLLEADDWQYDIDPLDTTITTGFLLPTEHGPVPVHLRITPTPTGLELRAPFLANSGGHDGTVDPALATFVATLAYRHRLALGVDPRDGEIAAWHTVSLVGLDETLQARLLERAWRTFLDQVHAVVQAVLHMRQELETTTPSAPAPVDLARPLPLSA